MTEHDPEPPADVIEGAVPALSKTPLFQGIHALRYQRQAIIKRINESNGRTLICYVAGLATMIERDDTLGFADLLHNVSENTDVDLLLHTPGGDIDSAEKLVSMLRHTAGTGVLRVIVPDFAKSAGTLIALGADHIVMSETSELGPIDPQVVRSDGHGNRIAHSVLSYLEAYAAHSETLAKTPGDVVAQMMLNKLDPVTVKQFEAIRNRSREIAEKHLQHGMFQNVGNWSQAASELIDVKRWPSHGQPISWDEASGGKLGLDVEHLDVDSLEWRQYWQLYCLQRLAINRGQKIFESDYVSLVVDGDEVS